MKRTYCKPQTVAIELHSAHLLNINSGHSYNTNTYTTGGNAGNAASRSGNNWDDEE